MRGVGIKARSVRGVFGEEESREREREREEKKAKAGFLFFLFFFFQGAKKFYTSSSQNLFKSTE